MIFINRLSQASWTCARGACAFAFTAAGASLVAGCDGAPAEKAAQAAPVRSAAGAIPGESIVDGQLPPTANVGEVHVAFTTDAQYAIVLEGVVVDDGAVDYRRLAQEPLKSQLAAVVAGYAGEKLPAESQRHSRMALWCNAFNANMLQIAFEESTRAGFTTIKDVPDLFASRKITVAGESLTLNALEDRIRSMNDPRIHAALVYAARSCPPLRSEPYTAARLDEQLNQQCLAWLDDPGKHRPGRRGLLLSQIFEWYADDFQIEPYNGALGFIRKHGRSGGSLRNLIRGMGGSPPIGYVPFNWDLNRPLILEQPAASDPQETAQP